MHADHVPGWAGALPRSPTVVAPPLADVWLRPWSVRKAAPNAGERRMVVGMDHCARCERPAPSEGSGELKNWWPSNNGGRPTCPQCAAKADAELEFDDQVLDEMEKAEGWDRPPGLPPRQWPRP